MQGGHQGAAEPLFAKTILTEGLNTGKTEMSFSGLTMKQAMSKVFSAEGPSPSQSCEALQAATGWK